MDSKFELEKVWDKCLDILRVSIPQEEFSTWIKPIKIVSFMEEENSPIISIPSDSFYDKIDTHYIGAILNAFNDVTGIKPNKAFYRVVKDSNANISDYKFATGAYVPNSYKNQIFNPSKTFDSFIEGESNRLARNAGITISEYPGSTALNPFFIYGNVGLGKTHLMNAIGMNIRNKFPQKKMLMVEADEFTKQFTSSSITGKINDFVHYYQQFDVLFIDNVQFFSDKSKTQDAFFNIFNFLHTNRRQLVLSSDRSLALLQGFEDRLLSRFKWGLSAELETPDFGMRKSIVKYIVGRDEVKMDSKVIEHIAKNVNTNIREIEGVITSMIAESVFNKKDMDIDLANAVINKIIRKRSEAFSHAEILEIISEYFDVEPEKICSKSRSVELLKPRHIYMYLLKDILKMPLKKIGELTGGRTHSTVISGCKNAENLYRDDILLIKNKIKDSID